MCENKYHGIPEVELCVNIPEVKGREQCVIMKSRKKKMTT